jgi:hypothetical protein
MDASSCVVGICIFMSGGLGRSFCRSSLSLSLSLGRGQGKLHLHRGLLAADSVSQRRIFDHFKKASGSTTVCWLLKEMRGEVEKNSPQIRAMKLPIAESKIPH